MRLQGRGRRLRRRTHDSAASAAPSRLLDPDLLRGASPVLSDPCTPVNARHIHVMCATKGAQRARARAVCVEVWVSYGRKSGRGVTHRVRHRVRSGRPKHEIVIFSSRAPARAREDEDNVSACGPTFDASRVRSQAACGMRSTYPLHIPLMRFLGFLAALPAVIVGHLSGPTYSRRYCRNGSVR